MKTKHRDELSIMIRIVRMICLRYSAFNLDEYWYYWCLQSRFWGEVMPKRKYIVVIVLFLVVGLLGMKTKRHSEYSCIVRMVELICLLRSALNLDEFWSLWCLQRWFWGEVMSKSKYIIMIVLFLFVCMLGLKTKRRNESSVNLRIVKMICLLRPAFN